MDFIYLSKFVDLENFYLLCCNTEYLLKFMNTDSFGGNKMKNEIIIYDSYLLTFQSSDGSGEGSGNYKSQ